ncbi:MAG: hypothetical protein H6R01_1128 [Burkholderiaceae bacterium]|nr:hypothetical protein [Burkholderiaceae bacterium]
MFCIRLSSAKFSRQLRMLAMLLVLAGMLLRPAVVRADATADYYFKLVTLDNAYEIASLLNKGISPNLTEPKRGDSGLILALREEAMQVFKLLLDAPGVDLEIRARNGDNALMIAAWKENRTAVEALLKKGAEVNREGWTALHYAAAKGNNDIVRLLLDHDADLDATSPAGITPLMMAAQGGHIYTVKLLHDMGADATIEDDHGRTAVTFAARNGHNDIVVGLKHRLSRPVVRQPVRARKSIAAKQADDFPEPHLNEPVRLPPMD